MRDFERGFAAVARRLFVASLIGGGVGLATLGIELARIMVADQAVGIVSIACVILCVVSWFTLLVSCGCGMWLWLRIGRAPRWLFIAAPLLLATGPIVARGLLG